MARHFDGTELLVASHNMGKVHEIRLLLAGYVDQVLSAAELALPEPEETATTFSGNAALKARAAAEAAGKIALADDSGLCVAALNGDPGIYSARWGGPEKDFDLAMDKVLTALDEAGAVDRQAWFVCALSMAWPDGHVETFEGRVIGQIVNERRGARGFGYDPIFIPDGATVTFAEMEPEHKHAISHRTAAFSQLVATCFQR